MKPYTIEGFLDSAGLGEFGVGAFIVKPVIKFYEECGTYPGNTYEEAGLDLSLDGELSDEGADYHKATIMRVFNTAKKQHENGTTNRYLYFKVGLEYDHPEDPDAEVEEPFNILSFEGHEILRPMELRISDGE